MTRREAILRLDEFLLDVSQGGDICIERDYEKEIAEKIIEFLEEDIQLIPKGSLEEE